MAKKPTLSPKSPIGKAPVKAPAARPATPAPVSTPVRTTPVPKAAAKSAVVTQEMIAKRAYEIWQSGTGGSEYDNWTRAERELRGA